MSVEMSDMAARAELEPIAAIITRVMREQAGGKDIISLAAGMPDPTMLPIDILSQLQADAQAAYPQLLNYTRPEGWPPLNDAFAHLLATEQGVQCTPDQVMVTSGGMEALSIAAQMIINPGDVVLVESPAFSTAIRTFLHIGAKVVHVACDEHGMIPEALRKAIEEHAPKLVSLMPDFLNPSGITMPEERREQIAHLLEEFDLFAVEDGAYSHLVFDGKPLRPLQSYAPKHVFYEYSVSKLLAPAMRTGALVVPDAIWLDKAKAIKAAYNMQASAINQAITERFITGDYRKKHVEKLRATYKRRRDVMSAALQKYLPKEQGFDWNLPEGGMFLWFTAPDDMNLTAKLDDAFENGVAYVPGELFFAQMGQAQNAARLNFASTPDDKIDEAIRRLAKAFGQ